MKINPNHHIILLIFLQKKGAIRNETALPSILLGTVAFVNIACLIYFSPEKASLIGLTA
jgi:hypothetical protein